MSTLLLQIGAGHCRCCSAANGRSPLFVSVQQAVSLAGSIGQPAPITGPGYTPWHQPLSPAPGAAEGTRGLGSESDGAHGEVHWQVAFHICRTYFDACMLLIVADLLLTRAYRS